MFSKRVFTEERQACLIKMWTGLTSQSLNQFSKTQRTRLNSFNYQTWELSEARVSTGSQAKFWNIIRNIIHDISNFISWDFQPRAVRICAQHSAPNTHCQLEPLLQYKTIVSKRGEICCFFHHWKSIMISKYSLSKWLCSEHALSIQLAKQKENQNIKGWTRLNRSLAGNICDKKTTMNHTKIFEGKF